MDELVHSASAYNTALNQRQLSLINHALKTSKARYTVESHRVSHGVSYETSRSDLLKLVHEGMLTQRKVGKAHVFLPASSLRAVLNAARGTGT